jgi:ATP-dependent protease ClpP protease subunit
MQNKYSFDAKNNNDDDNEDFAPFPAFKQKKPYRQYEQTFQFQHIHFYISEDIGEPNQYSEMTHRILLASQNDVIYIHLNTSGGHLDTGVQIINAMQSSAAKIITVLDGMAYSLGTLILLAGDEIIINDNCIAMFHNFRGGVVGKGNELTSQLEATVKWFADLAKQIYIPFLSDEELNRILKGEDLWMRSTEIRKRLEKMAKILATKDLNKSTKTPRAPKEKEKKEDE